MNSRLVRSSNPPIRGAMFSTTLKQMNGGTPVMTKRPPCFLSGIAPVGEPGGHSNGQTRLRGIYSDAWGFLAEAHIS